MTTARRTGCSRTRGHGPLLLLLAATGQAQTAIPEASSRLDEHRIEVGGFGLHYRSGGSGPALFLLHGFTLSGAQWDSVLPALTRDFTVIVPDLPDARHTDTARMGRPRSVFPHRVRPRDVPRVARIAAVVGARSGPYAGLAVAGRVA